MFCTRCRGSRRALWRALLLAIVQLGLAFCIASMSGPARALEDIEGDWHGRIESPAGPMTVIVTLNRDDDQLVVGFQVPAQAPGVVIPTTETSFDGDTLSFRVPRAAATYTGLWNPAERRFEGTFNQGVAMELDLEPGLPPALPVVPGLDGRWTGTLMRNGVDLRLVLNVVTGDNGTVATLDSPDMGATGLPVQALSRSGDAVRFQVPVASVTFDAVLDAAQTEMCGEWQRPGQPDATVCLQRRPDASDRNLSGHRPQEPGDDVPYLSREIRFANPRAAIELAGTLTLPEGEGPFPAAVLISGSGPQDRDETFMGHKPFLVLADHLTRNGIAVLRYDDRGFGASGGDHWAATTADFATDAAAAVEWLSRRPEIDSDAIGLIGHSEGGLVAPITAGNNANVAWVILLAAPGVDMLELVASQTEAMALTQGVSAEELQRVMPVNRRIWRIVAGAADTETTRARLDAMLTPDVLTTLGANPDRKPVIIESSLRPWLRYLLRFDPAPYLTQLKVPVLALNGSLDVQVPATENLAAIDSLLAGNPDATIVELPGLNHLFQTAKTGALGEYRDIEQTMAPLALKTISGWILERHSAVAGANAAGRPESPAGRHRKTRRNQPGVTAPRPAQGLARFPEEPRGCRRCATSRSDPGPIRGSAERGFASHPKIQRVWLRPGPLDRASEIGESRVHADHSGRPRHSPHARRSSTASVERVPPGPGPRGHFPARSGRSPIAPRFQSPDR